MMLQTVDPMSLDDVLEEALAWFEAYRRMGFMPDQIRFAANDRGDVQMQLHAQGLVFAGACGYCDGTPYEEIARVWQTKCAAWNGSMTDAERLRIWQKSFPANNVGLLVTKMVMKGFKLPCAMPS